MPRLLCVFLYSLLLVTSSLHAEDTIWPRFRGPNGTGVGEAPSIPNGWGEEAVRWRVRVPGVGHSSPVIWQQYLFITSALDGGQTRLVLAYDAHNGTPLWQRRLSLPPGPKHRKNSHASATPATDGKRLFVAFSSREDYVLTALDYRGNILWERDLGPFDGQHGSGVSPIVYKDLVILANHQDGRSFVIACDVDTGAVRWQVPCQGGKQAASYGTPVLYRGPDGTDQLILLSRANGLYALDPATGRKLWQTEPFPFRTVASPVLAGDYVVGTSGSGGQGRYLAVYRIPTRPGQTVGAPVWEQRRRIPYVPTPIYYNGRLFLWNDQGIVSCVDPTSWKRLWVARVPGADGRPTVYTSSPICISGRLLCISERGDVALVAAADEFRLLGHAQLNERVIATPAVAHGRLYIRTEQHLLCISGGMLARRQ